MTFRSDLDTWEISLIVYLLTGAVIILTTRARKTLIGVATPEEIAANPFWKTVVLYSIVLPVAFLFWPIFLPSWFHKKETLLDELDNAVGKTELRGLFEAMAALSTDGCETDEIPGATGEFGYDLSNPIPTHTTFGSTSYLSRLQTPDGETVQYERIGSFASPISESPVDGYKLTSADGIDLGVVYISPYHRRNSEKSPHGLGLSH